MNMKDYQPIPLVLREEVARGPGPCSKREPFLKMDTNMLGSLELQCCGKPWCTPGVFVYSETYGYITLKDPDLQKRAQEIVAKAVGERVLPEGATLYT